MLKEIGRVAVFIICAQTLLHFRAKESYEKYIKLLISMMVLLLLLKPFFNGGYGKEEDLLEEMVVGYERLLEKGTLLTLEQEDVETVAMNMVNDVILTEELQNSEESQMSEIKMMEEKEEVTNTIHVEIIQIGD